MTIPPDRSQDKPNFARSAAEYRDPYHRPDQPGIHPVGISLSGRSLEIRTQSVRHFRRTVCLALIAFTIGSLVIVLNSPARHAFLAPGPLANSHAQILGGLNPDRCQACHQAGGQTVAQWLAGSLTGDPEKGESACQSELCLKCHQDSAGGAHALNPHGVPPDQLAAITRRMLSPLSDGKAIPVSAIRAVNPQEISCRVCHREHHGGQFNLSAMTDRQCQVCHTSTFHSFDLDHPAFSIGANSAEANLNFDHSSHGTRHFTAANRTFDCKSCHPASLSGENRLTAGYDTACASCHNPALVDSQSRGIELLSMPVLDVEAIRAAGLSLADWPDNATGDFDGRLPPLQRLLLTADPKLQAVLNELPDGFQFSDIDPQRHEDLRLAAQLAAGYQRLFREISASGKSAVLERMERVAQTDPSQTNPAIREFLTELNDAFLQQAIQAWTPDPASGVAVQETGELQTVEGKAPSTSDSPSQKPVAPSGQLLARNPLADLLLINDAPSKSAQSESTDSQDLKSQSLPAGVALQQALPDLDSSPDEQRSDSLQQAANDWPAANLAGQLLSPNPLNSSEFRRPTSAQSTPVQSNLASDTEPSDYLAESRSPGNASPKQVANQPDQLPADGSFFSPSASATLAGSSRWKRDDVLMVITWQPTGHADRATRAILEWMASVKTGDRPYSGISHFARSMDAATAPGQCVQCHRMERPGIDDRLAWNSFANSTRTRGFTRFDHGPHVLVANCESCHTLAGTDGNPKGESPFRLASWNLSGAKELSPHRSGSDCGLNPVTARDCTACHRPNAAPAGCTTCHNYHVSNGPQTFLQNVSEKTLGVIPKR